MSQARLAAYPLVLIASFILWRAEVVSPAWFAAGAAFAAFIAFERCPLCLRPPALFADDHAHDQHEGCEHCGRPPG